MGTILYIAAIQSIVLKYGCTRVQGERARQGTQSKTQKGRVWIVCSNQNSQVFQNQKMKSARAGSLRDVRLLSMQFDTQRGHDLEDGREAWIAFAG